MRKAILGGAAAVLALAGGTGLYAATADADASLTKALGTRLPKTPLTAVNCGKIAGLCEVQAGTNLFYTDPAGRYLVIGRVYDMETRQDLTAARLLEISPETLVGGAASPQAPDEAQAVASPARPAQPGARTQKVSLEGLPASGAISYGSGPQTVTVFSDFRCGYCNRLHETLAGMNVKVIERPISVLGTRSLSASVICAADKPKALARAYNGEPLPAGKCDTSGLDANEAFAKANGFAGTPVIVRSDGAVVHGYRPREFLESWLKGAS
ncbi:DsbC family protein [Novosphingobium sp. HII-3]|uniref:DsbC family protein n=1 Tax=Novosphingobium sp. HII-3 TaxID=2075565 RepID=UPI000CDA7865|nr:DsbC family protein [Novosphingobium sp. HII-3]